MKVKLVCRQKHPSDIKLKGTQRGELEKDLTEKEMHNSHKKGKEREAFLFTSSSRMEAYNGLH